MKMGFRFASYSCISVSGVVVVLGFNGRRLTVVQYTTRTGGVFRSMFCGVESNVECVERRSSEKNRYLAIANRRKIEAQRGKICASCGRGRPE
jgi:hypothetical protein